MAVEGVVLVGRVELPGGTSTAGGYPGRQTKEITSDATTRGTADAIPRVVASGWPVADGSPQLGQVPGFPRTLDPPYEGDPNTDSRPVSG